MQFPKICVFRGWILVILWPKVMKTYCVPKIRVFLGLIFGISLAQSDEESWRSEIRVFPPPETFESCVVGELSCWGCELEIKC